MKMTRTFSSTKHKRLRKMPKSTSSAPTPLTITNLKAWNYEHQQQQQQQQPDSPQSGSSIVFIYQPSPDTGKPRASPKPPSKTRSARMSTGSKRPGPINQNKRPMVAKNQEPIISPTPAPVNRTIPPSSTSSNPLER